MSIRHSTAWPQGLFSVQDDPDEHKPAYLICPDGLMIPFSSMVTPGIDVARAEWIASTLNAALMAEDRIKDTPIPSYIQDWPIIALDCRGHWRVVRTVQDVRSRIFLRVVVRPGIQIEDQLHRVLLASLVSGTKIETAAP